jgi:ABC-type bacteriocin/lantibiotic exporter with double-glycine peptidase domain
MNALTGDLPRLDVPYFQQTRTATCGPACLMMVMKYWDPSIELSRRFEFQLWKKSYSFFLFGGTFQFGLAATAAKLGFKTEIYQKAKFSDAYPNFPQLVTLIENIVSYKTRRLKIPIRYGKDTITVISDSLHKKIPAIVFVNLKPILGENVFHWVVVTGLDEQNVYMNDPYVPLGFPLKIKKGYPVALDIFLEAISTETGRNLRLPSCVLLVYK